MPQDDQASTRNRLLQVMTDDDHRRVAPHLVWMSTELHQPLIAPHTCIERVFFPESGFVSVTTTGPERLEVGLIGREGFAGIAAVLDDDQTPYEHFVQAPGEVLGISRAAFVDALDESRTLRRLLLRYVHILMVQTAQTAFVNAHFDIEARLARWLLMCQDRLGGNELALTHEFLAMMLGVQRTSVTLALQILEGSGLIRARRGRVEIRDREHLLLMADRGYGEPEAAYERLIGTTPAVLEHA